jgi:molecular chaperone DnaK
VSKIVGIDLGTTNSLVATVDSGIPYVIADADRQRLCPSVVHFPAAGSTPLVGHAANRVRVIHPATTAYSVKRFMGRRGADIPREDMLVTYPVRGEGAGPVTIPIHGRDFTPEEVSAEVLRKLKLAAEADLLQRRAAQRHQARRRTRRLHRRAHRQRAHRCRARLRPRPAQGAFQNRRV